MTICLVGGEGKSESFFGWVVTIYTRITNRRLPGREFAFGQAMFDGERRPWVWKVECPPKPDF